MTALPTSSTLVAPTNAHMGIATEPRLESGRWRDRGRGLLAKAMLPAYRLLFITLSNTKDELYSQGERQLDYYSSLVVVVQQVLPADMTCVQISVNIRAPQAWPN